MSGGVPFERCRYEAGERSTTGSGGRSASGRRKNRKEAMNESKRTIEIKVERTIPAPLDELFDAWLNPKIPGTPWNAADKLLFNPEVDGFFYWLIQGTPHYGRFAEVERPGRIQHTWMSRSTLGEESMVTMTFTERKKTPS
jgi:uncharacterized protein YndB with AHSA1/START domain